MSSDKQALATLYSSLMAHLLHEDALYWRWVNVLLILQATGISAGYAVMDHLLGPILLFFIAGLTLVLHRIVKTNHDAKRLNLELMDAIGEKLTEEFKNQLKMNPAYRKRPTLIRLFPTNDSHENSCNQMSASILLKLVIWFLIFVDILLAVSFIYFPDLLGVPKP